MLNENELQLLCSTLRRAHVEVRLCNPRDLFELMVSMGVLSESGAARLVTPVPETVYKYRSESGISYIYFLLPREEDVSLLFIGPYLAAAMPRERIMEVTERIGVSPKLLRYVQEYYDGIPVLSEGSPLLLMLNVFCERVWGRPGFAITDVSTEEGNEPLPITTDGADADVMMKMRAMEQRYAFENELIEAVAHGQLHKEAQLTAAFSSEAFESRLADPVRNAKNYCIIMNTLLRKAAERGGVHPLHIDRLSSELAARIERMTDISENGELMLSIFRSYCRLVRSHATADLSPIVREAVLIIDSDPSGELTLSGIAHILNVSQGYLSAAFSREMGKSLSAYVRGRRIAYAAHLLDTTGLQIQTVALHSGIEDVQYFSKLFKREMGVTPKEYRDRHR